MTIAAKHFDPQLGIDIHTYLIPPSPIPIPLPTPHIGIVLDPFDYIPVIGGTVQVNGIKRATAGSMGLDIHIPVGGVWMPTMKMPMGPQWDDELFMGSRTVLADGEPFSKVAMPVLACNLVGMVSPIRLKKPKKPNLSLILPTTINIAIPTNVFVGGPPTISMTALLFRAGLAGLGKVLKKTGLAGRAADAFKKLRQKVFKNLPPGALKCKVLRAEPVDIRDGSVVVLQEDFTITGRLPLTWRREYRSTELSAGVCGHGWRTPADIRLEFDADGGVAFHEESSTAWFPGVPSVDGFEHAVLEWVDGARLFKLNENGGDHWVVQSKTGLKYWFRNDVDGSPASAKRVLPITCLQDLSGNSWRFERNGVHLVRIVESGVDGLQGRYLDIQARSGRIERIDLHDPAQGTMHPLVRYGYDEAGDLVAAIDALNAARRFIYQAHRMTRHTDRVGVSFQYAYDVEGRVVRAWGDKGLHDYCFEYDQVLNETRVTDSLGHMSIVKFNEDGLPLAEIDPLGGVTTFEYDERGRTTGVVDPMGAKSQFAYDASGNLTRMARPDGRVMEIKYDALSCPAIVIDPAGGEWKQVWDERGLLISQSSAMGATSSYEYDQFGQLRIRVDSRGAKTQFDYDRHGAVERLVDAEGAQVRFEHNALGLLVRELDPSGRPTQYERDALGRVVGISRPDGYSERCWYDGEGRLLDYTDAGGCRIRLEYVGTGQIGKRTQAGQSVTFHYDTEERLIGVTNHRGESFRLGRDALGRLVEEVDYWDQVRRFEYDAAGRLVSLTDPLGRTIRYRTDAAGRILEKLYEGVGLDRPLARETFRYDMLGRLVELKNAHRHVSRKFDPDGRVIEEVQDGFFVSHAYDSGGNRVLRETSAGNRVAFDYDIRGQLKRVAINAEEPIVIKRDVVGRVLEEVLSPQVRRELRHDASGRLTAQQAFCDDRPLFDTTYDYEPSGNLIERRDSEQGRDQYAYDPIGSLLSHTDPSGHISRYLHDHAGGHLMTRVHQTPHKKVAGGDSESSGDWVREGRCDGVSYVFDRAGNLSTTNSGRSDAASLRLQWDANNRLIECWDGKDVTRYGYDPLGRRVFKRDATHTTWFYWDGDALAAEMKLANDPVRDLPIETGLVADVLKLSKRRAAFAGAYRHAREYVYYPGSFVPLALIDRRAIRKAAVRASLPGAATREVSAEVQCAGASRRVVPSTDRVSVTDSRPAYMQLGATAPSQVQVEKGNKDSARSTEPVQQPAVKDSGADLSNVAAGAGGFGQIGSLGLGGGLGAAVVSSRKKTDASPEATQSNPLILPVEVVGSSVPDKRLPLSLDSEFDAVDEVEQPSALAVNRQGVASDSDSFIDNAMEMVVYHYHVDPNGCPTRLTDKRGVVVWSVNHAAWGGLSHVHVSEVGNPIGFQGQYFDAESGFFYNRHRYYDPNLGQYISQDPIRLAGGLDIYAYGVNPIGWIDALGLSCSTITVFRVQGGTPPAASRVRIRLDAHGNPRIQTGTLNVSVGNTDHAQHFLSLRPGAHMVQFEIPTWMHDFIRENAIPQSGYKSNPLNQGGLAPKIVDPTTPGLSYELPPIWAKWLEEVAIPGSGKVT